jgi:Preprotein translocase subunit SecD
VLFGGISQRKRSVTPHFGDCADNRGHGVLPLVDLSAFRREATGWTVIRHGKIHLGLDLQGGTSFLIRLEPPASADGGKRPITKAMVDQAIEAIRKRVIALG